MTAAYQVLDPVDAHSPEWHEQRARGLGGSDASAILGLNPYKSAFTIWQEKTGKVPADTASPSEAAYWGTQLEPVLADELAKRLETDLTSDLQLRPAVGSLQSIARPWQLANVDRLVYACQSGTDRSAEPVAVAEIKTVGLRNAADWAEPDGIGKHALIQGVHYMAVTGVPVVYFGCLVGGQEFRWRALDRDSHLEEYLLEREEEFWRLVQSDTPPPIDGSDSTRDTLGRVYPKATPDKSVDLGIGAASLLAQRNKLADDIRSAEEIRQAIDSAIKDILGEAEVGLLHGEPAVRWGNVSGRRSINSKALRADYPEIADQYTVTGDPYRRFAIL
ncbi:lambda-exonuclease family protein [Kribbella sp. NPDC056861]|uniref:YqaJ viral recombinase family nuclease n=1 Tax=Kribbella sp. NPDC056861 TaxID=3154857 RepID=UPI0034125C81